MDWRSALWLIAALGALIGLGLLRGLPPDSAAPPQARATPVPNALGTPRGGFPLLVAIGILDNAARPAFLVYLPFVLQAKGAGLTLVGFALSAVFIGGTGQGDLRAAGESLGVTRTVVLTETGTALAILAVILLPLKPALAVLPLLGIALNGTSSVLYGTVPDLAPGGCVERAFAVFYTWTLGASAWRRPCSTAASGISSARASP